jgi:hypothetical protein
MQEKGRKIDCGWMWNGLCIPPEDSKQLQMAVYYKAIFTGRHEPLLHMQLNLFLISSAVPRILLAMAAQDLPTKTCFRPLCAVHGQAWL